MDIEFANSRLEKTCLSEKEMRKEFGHACARILKRRLEQLTDAATLEQLRFHPGHWHELTGDRSGQLAANLEGGSRLVFEPNHDPIPKKTDGGLDWIRVTAVLIVEIVDYH